MASEFLDVLLHITIPIVAPIGLGYLIQRWLKLDVPTLNRLIVWVILPCFLFHYLATGRTLLAAAIPIVVFTIVQFFVLAAVGWLTSTALRVDTQHRPIVALATAFPNSGNYGLPLTQLLLGREYLVYQAIIVSIHSILITSVGAAVATGGARLRQSIGAAFRTPLIPAVVGGLVASIAHLEIPAPVAGPIQLIGSAYTPLALLTLGAQLVGVGRGESLLGPLTVGTALRLVIAPALTLAAMSLFTFPGRIDELLIVTASAPVGVLLPIIVTEYAEDKGLGSALVFFSTILSPVTVTLTILAARTFA